MSWLTDRGRLIAAWIGPLGGLLGIISTYIFLQERRQHLLIQREQGSNKILVINKSLRPIQIRTLLVEYADQASKSGWTPASENQKWQLDNKEAPWSIDSETSCWLNIKFNEGSDFVENMRPLPMRVTITTGAGKRFTKIFKDT